LHITYAPLSESDVPTLVAAIGRYVPGVFAALYFQTNGLSLFATELSIHGLRRTNMRAGNAGRQPFSIVTPNTIERPRRAQDDWVFFASYLEDGSTVAICGDSGRVLRCLPPKAHALAEWGSIDEFLLSEIQRIDLLYDEAGRRRVPFS
jgi:hypothetical protein